MREQSMSDLDLQHIQALQFRDLKSANAALKDFLKANFPYDVVTVDLRPSAVSLNSINGVLLTQQGEKLFFKTHIEPQSIIHEYYNSTVLAEAGYPVIQPVYSSTEWGKQLLIYPFFELPSLFEVARELETTQSQDTEAIVALQQQADDRLWQIYQQTLAILPAQDHASAPVHQLFFHRLTGGRFDQFYRGQDIYLPGQTLSYEQLAQRHWQINGIAYEDTLSELVRKAIDRLDPNQNETVAVVGHGDAHNGNVFVDQAQGKLVYFDPAFAGRHSPFLDLTKPVFHNVFAIWMYFPQAVAQALSIQMEIHAGQVIVTHDFVPSALRIAFLHSKLNRVLKPLLQHLNAQNLLSPHWREELKLALFCCPFLTMNLRDTQRFPPEITLLGLAIAIEMGSQSGGDRTSLLDTALAQVSV
jgi:hypothetical protein